MSKRVTQNSVHNTKGDTKSGQFTLDGTADNAATFVQRFYNEVDGRKGNGFDSYVNENGPSRSDTLTNIDPIGNGKIGLLAIDALHQAAANGDKDAETALASIRAYDTVAAEKAAQRKQQNAFEKLRQNALDAGIAADKVDAFLGLSAAPAVEVAVAVVGESDGESDGENVDAETVEVGETVAA